MEILFIALKPYYSLLNLKRHLKEIIYNSYKFQSNDSLKSVFAYLSFFPFKCILSQTCGCLAEISKHYFSKFITGEH